MSYTFETQYNSPNYTSGNNGRKMIIIHWWDDPAKQPSYSGTITTLCNPNRGASAHFVATGTDRKVACLVNLEDTAWHAGTYPPAYNPNPDSIGIECDPRCRPEDYDVVAELVANIRSAYGDLPLRGHKEFANTRCPGDWDLARLDALARTKDGSGDWGVVCNLIRQIPTPEPTQPPAIVEEPNPEPEPVIIPEVPVEPVKEPELPKDIVITSDPNLDNPCWRYKTWLEKLFEYILNVINKLIRRK